jgi:transcriptional regulator with XRE-family HTH domain
MSIAPPPRTRSPSRARLTAEDRIIAANIRHLRLERGITQEQVASLLGITYQQVQKYESGVNRIGLPRLRVLQDFYDVPFERFMDGLPGTEQRAPQARSIADPDVMALCQRLDAITDRDMRRKARRILDTLISQG